MELVARLAGESHSDSPKCTCPVLAALVRATNDRLPSDHEREIYLRPLVPQLVRTVGGRGLRELRAYAACDFAVRRIAPLQLARAGQEEAARRLAGLPRIESPIGAALASAVLQSAARELRMIRWLTNRCEAQA